MPNLMDFKCGACGNSAKYTPTTEHPEALPPGWRVRTFKGKGVLLCDWCNAPSNFVGGINPRLEAMLEAKGIDASDE